MKQTYRIVKVEVKELGVSYYIGQIKYRYPYTGEFEFVPIEETRAFTYDDCFKLVIKYHEEEKKNNEIDLSKEFTLD